MYFTFMAQTLSHREGNGKPIRFRIIEKDGQKLLFFLQCYEPIEKAAFVLGQEEESFARLGGYASVVSS